MALAEGAAARILAGQAHTEAIRHQAAERERLCCRPVKSLSAGKHLAPSLDHAVQRLVDFQVIGDSGERAAEAVEQLGRNRGVDIAPCGFRVSRLVEPGPTPAEPVRSEEHTSELQSLMRISYAVFCLTKQKKNKTT